MIPTDAAERKALPLARGVLDYFPDALLAVAEVSRVGNEQHHAGQPIHWDKSKSTDEADALLRHLVERGTRDTDGLRHSAKVAWRALALLQREIDAEQPAEVLRRNAMPAVSSEHDSMAKTLDEMQREAETRRVALWRAAGGIVADGWTNNPL